MNSYLFIKETNGKFKMKIDAERLKLTIMVLCERVVGDVKNGFVKGDDKPLVDYFDKQYVNFLRDLNMFKDEEQLEITNFSKQSCINNVKKVTEIKRTKE